MIKRVLIADEDEGSRDNLKNMIDQLSFNELYLVTLEPTGELISAIITSLLSRTDIIFTEAQIEKVTLASILINLGYEGVIILVTDQVFNEKWLREKRIAYLEKSSITPEKIRSEIEKFFLRRWSSDNFVPFY